MKIYAIIVTYNPDIDVLLEQRQSLYPQVDGVIYVDNDSKGKDFINKVLDAKCQVYQNVSNVGLAKAQNQGIEQARQNKADFVILFDQDSIPPSDFVEQLLSCYKEACGDNKVALIGPGIFNRLSDHPDHLDKGIILKGFGLRFVPLSEKTEVSYCIASGSLIPMSVIDDVGGMEEKLFIDGIDMEWCLRAKHKGYKIFQTNRASLSHCLGDGTSRRIKSHSPQREYYITRNAVWMIRKRHIPFGYRLRKLFTTAGRMVQSTLQLEGVYAKAELKGFIHGLTL